MPVSLVQSDIWKSVAYPALILTGVCLMMIEQRESMSVASTTYARNESHFHGLARKNESLEPILQNDIIFPTLMDEYRTLWTAGWNARHTQYYLGVPPKVTWTPEAEDIVEREYRRLHFPADCSNVRGTKKWENRRTSSSTQKNTITIFPYFSTSVLCRLAGCQCIRMGPHVGGEGLSV